MDRLASNINTNKATTPFTAARTTKNKAVTEPLQTRCPNCHTQFYAYPKQLEVHQNLVRCGLCLHVFNAQTCVVTNQNVTPPTFLKKRFSKMRTFLISTCAILSITLIILLAILFRAKLLEQFPNSIKVLAPICQLIACTLPPVHSIDAWAISHSELRKGKETNTYVLLSTLQNRANFNVELPALEVSLINAQGELVLRRTLDAHDYLPMTQTALLRNGLAGNANLPVEITLHTGDTASSYRLFLLYP